MYNRSWNISNETFRKLTRTGEFAPVEVPQPPQVQESPKKPSAADTANPKGDAV